MAENGEKLNDEKRELAKFQSKPYTWKGFLSSTVPTGFDIFNKKDVVKISLGNQHIAFLTSDHAVYCSGSGEYGQLGHGKFTDVTKKPVLVSGLKGENVTDVVCGGDHTGVVCADGIVFCWGNSAKGQCGTTEEKVNTPKLVTLADETCDPVVTQISCGDTHTLALTNQGQVWAWGTGPQLGCGTGNNVVATPQKLDAFCGRNVLKISCGSTYSLAIVQKIKTLKTSSLQSNDTEEDGDSSVCIACDEDAFSVHEEGDTLVVTDNHICIHDKKSVLSSVKSISPDSLDISIVPKKQNAIKEPKERTSDDDNASQGTYTLEDEGFAASQADTEILRETDLDEVDVSFKEERNDKPSRPCDLSASSSSSRRLPLDTSAKQFLLRQMRPVKLVSSLPHGQRTSSRDKIFNFVPRMLVSGIERIVSPQSSFLGNLKAMVPGSMGSHRSIPAITTRHSSVSVEADLSPFKSQYDDVFDDPLLQTEVWSWGRGTMGQLGQGDTLERPHPVIIKQLSAKGIVNIYAGVTHCIAVASSGLAFSWGASSDGQLGHTGQLVPKKVKMPGSTLIWGAALGSNHSLLLTDGPSFQPDVYYLGKQPSLQELRNEGLAPESPLKEAKDSTPKKRPTSAISKSPTVKYAARAKQPEKMMFMRKCGWMQRLSARGDVCACISDKNNSGYISILSELSATERLLYYQLSMVKTSIWKSLQSTDMLKLLENSIYLHALRQLLDLFTIVSNAVGVNSIHLTRIVQRTQYFGDLALLSKAKEITGLFELYAKALCDFITLSGFKHIGKIAREILQKHDNTFMELLGKEEKLTDFGPGLRRLFQLPIDRVKSYAYLLGKLQGYFPEEAHERQMLKESSLSWEKLQATIDSCMADAEDTKAFWDSCPNKLAESLKRPDRRIIRDSRKKPLQLVNAGRLSSNWFLLFNDVIVHAQGEPIDAKGVAKSSPKFTTHHVYNLSLVWAEPIPDTDQVKNALQLTMPEKTLSLQTNSQTAKAEWLWTINQTIDVLLTSGKEQKEIKSPNGRVPPKLARPGKHTFANHPQGRDATYEGMWLTGKPHGNGTLTWPDRRKYSGNFTNGLQNGFGWSVEPASASGTKTKVYQGQWKEGKREGRGFLRHPNGDVYLGYFRDNQCNGNGILQCVNPASIYVGQWKKDCFNGYGVKDDSLHGEKYMGFWQDNHRHGDGFVITVDGVYYEGTFNQDKLQGAGILVTEDGTCFQGQLTTGPTLNGKGTLTMPNGDYVEGNFNGLWGDEVKLTGNFNKFAEEGPPPSLTRMLGQNTASAEAKWLDIFSECWQDLGCADNKPDSRKAWTCVAAALAVGKRELEFLEGLQADVDVPTLRKAIEELERIPQHNKNIITADDLKEKEKYLSKAFDLPIHPLGRLIENLVNAFRASYVGIGAHQLLLPYAIDEVKCFIKKSYEVVRLLFPEFPDYSTKPRTPVMEQPSADFYYDYTNNDGGQSEDSSGQVEQAKEDDVSQLITPESLLHPLLLPKLCPALLTMYAVKNSDENERYLDRLNRLNRQHDMSLMAYLGIDQKFWLFEDEIYSEPSKLKEMKDVSYLEAIHTLERISTAFSPADKLGVIESTMEAIDSQVQSKEIKGHVWSMDDLFPLFQYVVTRARIPHLGSEIQFIEDLMDPGIIHGRLGILMTTLKACYIQICNENLKAL